MKMYTFLLAIIALTVSCDNDDENSGDDNGNSIEFPNVDGMNYVLSDRSFDETYDMIVDALNANPNINIVAEVNHQQNASSVGEDLNPTRVVFFGNPALGTPIMQINQQAGLDLPQRMLVYQDDNDDVFVGFNSTGYIASRHGVGEATTLPMIATALENFSTTAADGDLVNQSTTTALNDNIIVTTSEQGFVETYDSLIEEITNNQNLTIISELDHTANAASVDLELLPTRVVIFGNPALGTPIMKNAQTAALDLPQKMLVYQNDIGTVTIAFNSTSILTSRHGVTDNEETLQTILDALQNLADTAIVND